MMNNFLNGMFGKVGNGMCRLSMNGGIAVKTSTGYKTYNIKTNKLTNCSNFVFDIGEEFFFVIPTNKVEKGDINGLKKQILVLIREQENKRKFEDLNQSQKMFAQLFDKNNWDIIEQKINRRL